MNAKQKKMRNKYLVILLIIVIVSLVFGNVITYFSFDSNKELSIKYVSEDSETGYYTYESSMIDNMYFVVTYTKDGVTVPYQFFPYEFNNAFHVCNLSPFNILNRAVNQEKDEGGFNLSIWKKENGVYIDTFSTLHCTKPQTFSILNLMKNQSFQDFTYTFQARKVEGENKYMLVEGLSNVNDSLIEVYLIYE